MFRKKKYISSPKNYIIVTNFGDSRFIVDLKGTYYAPFYKISSKYPQIIFYSLLKLPLLGYEPKRSDFECCFNANELVLEKGGASRAPL